MEQLIGNAGFRNPARAAAQLMQLSQSLSSFTFTSIRQMVQASADPDSALNSLLEFRTSHQEAFDRFSTEPLFLQNLISVFAHSRFLTMEVLRHPDWIESLIVSGELQKNFHAQDFLERAILTTDSVEAQHLPARLALYRKQQLLRILLRDVNGQATLAETTNDISHLTDAILETSYRRIFEQIEKQLGLAPGKCSVIALGKLGGRELNYSSDIDLLFVFEGENLDYFRQFVNQFTSLLSSYTSEGQCYRIDLRLRPEGRLGEVAISLESAMQYYRHRARDWELQMLIKARTVAGDRSPGDSLLRFVQPLIYSTTLDFSTVESVTEGRLRIHEQAAQKRGKISAFDIKLMPGGIRDIEFLVQCLQRLHGGREPWVRNGGTLLALSRLLDKELLSPSEYSNLTSAYEFLRHLEHRLQIEDDRQTHTLPSRPEELSALSHKMPADEMENARGHETLIRILNHHLERVQQLYERVIHAQKPIYYGIYEDPSPVTESSEPDEIPRPLSSNLIRFLDHAAPVLAQQIQHHHASQRSPAFELFLERLQQYPDWLKKINDDADAASSLLTIFQISPWMSNALNRDPKSVLDLIDLKNEKRTIDHFQQITDERILRKEFRREMFRILAQSLCLGQPIFETLRDTSALADAVISAAYRMAIHQVQSAHTPKTQDYLPSCQMMVVALGRLGMLEFDLGSDADLVFVLPDEDQQELGFWTDVAERLIDILTAYTGEGTLIAVDTRLRPGGRDGQLVQTEQGFKDYFENRAEAWEGISYMKARTIAGDPETATRFLTDLQKIDWRRYGQSGRSRTQLLEMRTRLEKEQGPANQLKAGKGGYYDIDFALMYLRLKGAGIFYKALNTPERIDIVEQMGHLNAIDADFLRKAATFYRAIDHGIRLQMGQSAGNLPASSARLNELTIMAARWIPDEYRSQSLKSAVKTIQTQTREYFSRLFNQ